MNKHDRTLVEVTISAPADEVWQSLRDPARLQQWFGWDAETLPAEIQTIFFAEADADPAARMLRFRDVEDRFEIEARGATSVVRVVRPAPAADTDWDDVFDDMVQGWIAFVQQWKFALEQHAADNRRTLYFSGSPKAFGAPRSIEAVGLDRTGRAGDGYASHRGATPLAGRVWHRGRHQLGVTVEGWGNGLLIAMDRPPSDGWPHGGSQIILTTYGLDDEAFAALQQPWSDWWRTHFSPRG